MKQIKQTKLAINGYDEVNETLQIIAVLQLTAENKENELQSKIIELKKLYEPAVKELRDKIADQESRLEEFCKSNKKDFTDQRSRELTFGRIGYRTGKSSLKLLNKKFNWEWVKDKFQDLFNLKYINVETSLNKTKIISDAERDILSVEQLEAAGVKVVKGESPYYEINWDEIKVENLN